MIEGKRPQLGDVKYLDLNDDERLLMPTVVIVVAPGPRCKCHWYSMQNGRTSISV